MGSSALTSPRQIGLYNELGPARGVPGVGRRATPRTRGWTSSRPSRVNSSLGARDERGADRVQAAVEAAVEAADAVGDPAANQCHPRYGSRGNSSIARPQPKPGSVSTWQLFPHISWLTGYCRTRAVVVSGLALTCGRRWA